MTKLTHVNANGEANMVDITTKEITQRVATAQGFITLSQEAISSIQANENAKGDVLAVARIAGIQAAKKCSDLIPLCHPLMLTKVQVDFEIEPSNSRIRVISRCQLSGKTGVEMEALTAVSISALTIFDMCKAVDPSMIIHDIKVLSKEGGKSKHWQHPNNEH